ncbi:MAG: hypothetical protein ACYDAG_18725 [Chloroflexota bacterium]
MAKQLLTINTGSSSVRAAIYEVDAAPCLTVQGVIEGVGLPRGRVLIRGSDGQALLTEEREFRHGDQAVETLLGELNAHGGGPGPDAAGHRIVHGGSRYSQPELVTSAVMAHLRSLVPLDPMHLPRAIGAVETVTRHYASIPQVACFDTAFHRHMPRVAQLYGLPHELAEAGVVRYGFHGLSYEYVMQELRQMDAPAAAGRVVIAHLGNGASMAAIHAGLSVETTMGFTPAGGLVMGTRSGDLDPGGGRPEVLI